jgi:DNA-directed RNA polymerase specialized sigma subunit
MKYTHHDDNFVNFDDEFDKSDRFETPVEKDRKEVRKKVWRRTGNGQWEGERGLDLRENEEFTGAGLHLSKRRSGKRLTGFEEADLIRAYRAGDKSAGDRLIESLLWLVRGIAGNQKERGKLKYGRASYGPSFDDRVAAGIGGPVSAIEKYNFSRNTRLSTCARWWIMKSIVEECELWRYRGMGGQTRADRYLFSHSGAEAEEIAAKAHCSLERAEDAIGRLEMKELPYNSREGSNDDVGGLSICRRDRPDTGTEKKKSLVLADTYRRIEVHPQGHVVADEDWEAIKAARGREWRGQDFYDQTVSNLREGWKGEKHYAKHWRAHELNLRPEAQGYGAALKSISRELYADHQAKAHRDASALLALRNLLPPQRFLERLTDQLDRHAARRLTQIGRNAYAHELVERDHRREAARSEETQYLYPRFRSQHEKKETKHERQNRIRGNAAISIRSPGIGRRSDPGGRTTRSDLAQLHLQASFNQRAAGTRPAGRKVGLGRHYG